MAQSTYKSIANTGDTSASTIVISKPSGTVDGDLLVCMIGWSTGSSYTLTTLSGWTLIRTDSLTSGTLNLASYYKIASSEGSSYTWSFSGAVESAGSIVRVDTVNTSSPIATSNGAGTSGGSTNSVTFADTVSPNLASELILFPIFVLSTSRQLTDTSTQAVTTSNPTWTEVQDVLLDTLGGGTGTMNFSIAYANRTETTGTGNSSATCNGGTGPNKYISQKIVIANQQAFTFSNSDTVTDTDTITAYINTFQNITDTITNTDSTTTTTGKDWTNPSKNSTSWTNPNKS